LHSRECSFHLPDPAATDALGAALAATLAPGLVITLEGDLGAGKTSLVRAMLRALGHSGPVKSPTYALVELYKLSSLCLYHFDFYRFNDPEEFLDAGLAEYFSEDAVCCVEWPDKAAGVLPPVDLVVAFVIHGGVRDVFLQARSTRGETCLSRLTCPSLKPARHPLPFNAAG
jgi:tRNA threonylcarbamoyladenosine biosynthesis protein TsaE